MGLVIEVKSERLLDESIGAVDVTALRSTFSVMRR